MGIDIEWIDEDQSVIQFLSDGANLFSRALENSENYENTSCLRFIDPYGDTVFNQIQIKELISELSQLYEIRQKVEERNQIDSVIKLAKQAEGNVHTYIKFVGD